MPEKKRPISEIVKREDWQLLRKSLVGQWKKNPVDCCNKLKRWLGPVRAASNDELRIMMNYLTGTAFRIGRIKHPCIQKIRDDVSKEMKKRKDEGRWYK